jgi:hypothetical protein
MLAHVLRVILFHQSVLSCCAAYLSDVIEWYIRMPQLLKYIHLRHSVWVDFLSKVSPAVSQYIWVIPEIKFCKEPAAGLQSTFKVDSKSYSPPHCQVTPLSHFMSASIYISAQMTRLQVTQVHWTWGPFLTSTLAPRGKILPQGRTWPPGAKFVP